MPQYRFADYGKALSDASAIQGQRLQNRLAQMKMQGLQAQQGQQQQLGGLTQQYLGGNKEVLPQIAAIDTDKAKQLQDMSAQEREQARKEALDFSRPFMVALRSPNPAQAYQQAYAMAQQKYPEKLQKLGMPQQFEPTAVKQRLAAVGQTVKELMPKQERSTKAQELIDAGYKPGTPEFQQAMRQRIQPNVEYSATNVMLPSGERVRGRKTGTGQLEIADGQGGFKTAPSGSQMISTSLQGSQEDIGFTKPEVRNFHELESKMPYVQRVADRVQEGLNSGEYVGGISGDTLQVFNSLRNQVQQVRQQFGEKDISLSVDKYRDALGGAANMSNQVQSALIDLAYLTAKAKDPSGRISDKDLKFELQTFGLNTADPQIIMKRVNQKIGDLQSVYQAQARILGVQPAYEYSPDRVGDNNQPNPNAPAQPQTQPQTQPQPETNDPLGIRQ